MTVPVVRVLCSEPKFSVIKKSTKQGQFSYCSLCSRFSRHYIHVVFCWLRYERSRKHFSHTHLGVWVLVCGGIGHMAHKIAHFSCCRSPLPDLPPTHPCSSGSFFLLVSFFFSISRLLWSYLFAVGSSYSSFQIMNATCMNVPFQNCFFTDVVCELVADFSCLFYCLACCIVLTAFCMWFNNFYKGQAAWFGLAWLAVVCEKCSFIVVNNNCTLHY